MGTNMANKTDITISANFVADGIHESLEFWFETLHINGTIRLTPFDQIIQQLLDPAGLLTRARDFSVILIQLERWLRKREGACTGLSRNCEDFIEAMRTAVRAPQVTSFLVIFCPPSPKLRGNKTLLATETELRDYLIDLPGVDVLTTQDLQTLYPTEDYESYFDPYTERLAQIPYTRLCFATLGTMVARRLYGTRAKMRKVVVVDCDNTLWSGICGENGPLRVVVGPGRRALQQFLINQTLHGRLVCLCSKNEEVDALTVFDQHPDMLMRREHLAAWKVNWTPKPDNLRALSEELGLSLDGFVFIDDDAYECATVRTSCPEVLTLHLPTEEAEIDPFLQSAWDLDMKAVTLDDRKRTEYYHQNAERTKARDRLSSLDDFLASLELKVEISPLAAEDLVRASQLTERTNQFNLNGVHRSYSDLQAIITSDDRSCWIVRARDRYGDYGTVGLMICSLDKQALYVESLLLSCRALGKTIEKHMTGKLAEVAQSAGADRVEFAYQPTARNTPLRMFLDELCVLQAQDRWTIDTNHLRRASSPAFQTTVPAPGTTDVGSHLRGSPQRCG
jgi:FkbH-like protein